MPAPAPEPAAPAATQGQERLQAELGQLRLRYQLEAGQRHLDLGVWCRKRGLVGQGTAEFLLAVEISQGRHPGARAALDAMRDFEDAFWKKSRRRRPATKTIDDFEKRARAAAARDEQARLALALWAHKKKLDEEAGREFRALLEAREGPLEFDKRGRIVLSAGRLPETYSASIREEAVEIGGGLYLRDHILEHLPGWGAVQQSETERLRVRAPEGFAGIETYLAIGSALLPQLEAILAARPTRRLDLLVFSKRDDYEAFLVSTGLFRFRTVSGLADSGNFVALVCAEGRTEDVAQSIALHELSHLYSIGITRAVMPSWYAEGLAESFGGQGTFTWENGELETGGLLGPGQMRFFRDPGARMRLDEILAGDAFTLITQDQQRAWSFYAHAWALVRFLRSGAGEEVARRFEEWELRCHGAALGAQAGRPDSHDHQPAAGLFQETFGPDLPRLAEEFEAWLDALCGADAAPPSPR